MPIGETQIADCAQWFGADRLNAYVHGETLIAYHAHWFGVTNVSHRKTSDIEKSLTDTNVGEIQRGLETICM